MGPHLENLSHAVRAVAITSPWSFTWFGEFAEKRPRSTRRDLPAGKVREYLTFALQRRLYEDYYCPGAARPTDHSIEPRSVVGRIDFVAALSAANRGQGGWDAGWTLDRCEGETFVVARNSLNLQVERADVASPSGAALSAGATVAVRFPRELLGVSPGFYMAVGDQPLRERGGVVRIYFNLQAAAAVQVTEMVTGLLNRAGLGFKFKVLNDDTRFDRCDSAVLYLNSNDYAQVHPLLRRIHGRSGGLFGSRTPAFTKALARGLGLAENPPAKGAQDIESFGMHRCRLVAEALVEAHERRASALDARLAVVIERFTREGLSLEQPYLNAGSTDDYAVFDDPPAAPKTAHAPRPAAAGGFLETAAAIGRSLVETALWHENRCTWLGALPPNFAARKTFTRPTHATLGPDLYGGVAGVALFLAELARATGDRRTADTAIAASRQALQTAGTISPGDRIGLYTGWTGIAWALARVSAAVASCEVLDPGARLALAAQGLTRDASAADLLAGRAGAVAGLVALHERIGDAALIDAAKALADGLVAEARRDAAGRASWPRRGHGDEPDLTGLSHGAAGVAYGLLRLYGVVRDARYLDCALAAFAYEAMFYEPEVENWPDFRGGFAARTGGQRSFATFWCHGAPGIALSRMLAAEVAPERDFRAETAAGLRTTRASLTAGLQHRAGNFCLCHGLAGNSEVLLCAGCASSGDGDRTDIELARQVGAFGVDQYGRHSSWPCGVGPGINQSLMLGLSGIGHFYLRLNDPSIGSVVAI